jgi:hypothetical protein
VIVNLTQRFRTGHPVGLDPGDGSRMLPMIVPIAWPGRGAGFEGPAAQADMVARAAAGALVIAVACSNA